MPEPAVPDSRGQYPNLAELATILQQASGRPDLPDLAASAVCRQTGASTCRLLVIRLPIDTMNAVGSHPPGLDLPAPGDGPDLVQLALAGGRITGALPAEGVTQAHLPSWLKDTGGQVLAAPLMHNGRAMGVVVADFQGAATEAAIDRLAATAGFLTPLLRGEIARCYQARKNSLAGRLLQTASRLSRCAGLDDCLAEVCRAAADITGSAGAVYRVAVGGDLVVRSFFTRCPAGSPVTGEPNDAAAAARVLEKGRPVVEEDVDGGGGPASRDLLAVPMTQGSGVRGVLTVFDRSSSAGEPRRYTRLEREALAALAGLGRDNLAHFHRESQVNEISGSLEQRVRELAFLHQVSRSAIHTGGTPEILRSLLTAVTHREGLGFDRAFLFLHESEAGRLVGTMGVEVAGRAGDTRRDHNLILESHSDLDHQVAGMTLALDPEQGVLPLTVLEKRPFSVRLPRDQNLVCDEVIRLMGSVTTFVTVPLLSEDRVLGVIWVDNLHTGRAIGSVDIDLLVSAAAQAGMIVERSFQHEAIESLSERMLELQKRLTQWEKMAALGEMAATVAHDIRNPLVAIGGFARRLRKLVPAGGDGDRYAGVIIREVDRLERILGDVMTYSRDYGVMELEEAELGGLLAECAGLFKENFKKRGVTMELELEPDLPRLRMDQRQVRQAVLNILFNAGEAVADGGRVVLRAAGRQEEGGRWVEVSVTDNGPGIAPEDMDRIFKPFFTTKSSGTGLGLAISQRAVSGHGGQIQVDNRPGEGVTFTVRFPVGGAGGRTPPRPEEGDQPHD